jgi:hypothetical protein
MGASLEIHCVRIAAAG